MPTVWSELSNTSSRSGLFSQTSPEEISSASSVVLPTRRSSTFVVVVVVQPEVSKAEQLAWQRRVPPLNPWDWQVWPLSWLPSQTSVASRIPFPHEVCVVEPYSTWSSGAVEELVS